MNVIILFSFLAVLFACLSQKKKVPITDVGDSIIAYRYEKFSSICFVLSFLLLAVPCFLCGEGADMPVYVNLYNSWTFESLKNMSFEVGYILLNIFLRIFFDNAYIGLGIIKLLSLFLVYKSLYMLRNQINIGFSVFAYVVLLYPSNYNILRMMLALGIVFFALSHELTGNSKKAIILMILAFLFHYTSVIVLLIFCIYKVLGKKLTTTKITILSFVLILIYGNIIPILQNVVSSVNMFNKYITYLNSANSYSGMAQVVLFIPVAVVLINIYRQGKQDSFYGLSLIFGITLFFTGSLGYMLPVISRTSYYFYFFAVTFLAAIPLVKEKYIIALNKCRINAMVLFSFLYIAVQFVIMYVMGDTYNSSGLLQYTLFWNK